MEAVSTPETKRFAQYKLSVGIAIYVLAAAADGYMTLTGMDGNLQLESNPAMRWTMQEIGPFWGLVAQKTVIGLIVVSIAHYGRQAIRNRSRWLTWIPTSRWGRAWMRRKDRAWIAYLPLYCTAFSQALAALSWLALDLYY